MNERELAELLQRHALLGPSKVLGELRITRADRRNRNHRIHTSCGRDLFVKQGSRSDASDGMAQEAAVYAWLAQPSIAERAGKHLLRCLGHDAAARALILEALPDAEDLHAYHLRRGRLSRQLAAELGRALGALHRATQLEGHRLPARCSVGLVRPWVFGLPCPEVSLLREASATNLKVLRVLQKEPLFERELTKLAASWSTVSLIHGDVKLANCLSYRVGRARRRRLKLVDWELGGFGDPRWDVACVFSSYLALWVWSIPMPRPENPALLAAAAQFPLAAIKETLEAFFESYVASAELTYLESPTWLETLVRMAGAHLVQIAYECASAAHELSAPILTLLQLARNVLAHPERAATALLGLSGSAPPSSRHSVVAQA